MREILARAPESRSQLRTTIDNRIRRRPLEIARLLAERYPGTPSMNYIPGVAWVQTLRLATLLNDSSLRAKVIRDVQPWLSGEEPLTGDRISLAGLAGTMVFGELAKTASPQRQAAEQLATEGIALAAKESEPGLPDYGSGWSDDVFLGTIAATTAQDRLGMEAAVRLITRYANQLQRPSGLWHHAPNAPVTWGRGNGFAARGIAETRSSLPPNHSASPKRHPCSSATRNGCTSATNSTMIDATLHISRKRSSTKCSSKGIFASAFSSDIPA